MSGHPEFSSNIARSVIGQERSFPVPSSTDWDSTIEKVSKEKPRANPFIKFLRKPVVRNTVIAAGLLITAGLEVKHYVDQNNEKIHKAETSSTFDPGAKEQYVNPNNETFMTLEEYEKTGIQYWESKTLTIPLPIIFKDNRTPTLHVSKGQDYVMGNDGLNLYSIDDGLQEGDIICSPIEGEIYVTTDEFKATGYMRSFTITIPETDSMSINGFLFRTSPSVIPLIDLDNAIPLEDKNNVKRFVKKGQPIAKIATSINGKTFNPQVSIFANYGSLKDDALNFATSDGKVILLKWPGDGNE
jgi:hypothetical protein